MSARLEALQKAGEVVLKCRLGSGEFSVMIDDDFDLHMAAHDEYDECDEEDGRATIWACPDNLDAIRAAANRMLAWVDAIEAE